MDNSDLVEQVKEDAPRVSISEIIHRCNDAIEKMSHTNPHRYLLYLCAFALSQLANRVDDLETKLAAAEKVH